MKKVVMKLIAVCMFATLILNPIVASASATTNMTKVLSYYHQKNYKKAEQYNKKLPKYANESCVKKMPSQMKKAYIKVVNKYYDLAEPWNIDGKSFMWDFYLSDIDNDKKADLLITFGTCEADVKLLVFQYKNKKAVKTGETYCSHSAFYAYPNHSGIIEMQGHMGQEAIYTLTLKGKTVSEKLIGSRTVSDDYLALRNELKGHMKYDTNSKPYLTYGDLK